MLTETVLIIHISCQIKGLFKVLRVRTLQSQSRPLRPSSELCEIKEPRNTCDSSERKHRKGTVQNRP